MSYLVEKIASEPAILIQVHADFDAHTEAQEAFEASVKLLAEQTEPVFAIWDVRAATTDLQSVMEGANISRTNATPTNERGSIVVTDNPLVKMAMEGMNSAIYGYAVIPVFEDIEAAIAYIHEQLDDSPRT